jgi:hypothetical protein
LPHLFPTCFLNHQSLFCLISLASLLLFCVQQKLRSVHFCWEKSIKHCSSEDSLFSQSNFSKTAQRSIIKSYTFPLPQTDDTDNETRVCYYFSGKGIAKLKEKYVPNCITLDTKKQKPDRYQETCLVGMLNFTCLRNRLSYAD